MIFRFPDALATRLLTLAVIGALVGPTSVAAAQRFPGAADTTQQSRPIPRIDEVDVEEHLEANMPLDLEFTRHDGQRVTLRDYVDGEHPVLFMFAYHSCPQLCSFVLDASVNATKNLEWQAGREYRLVTISIDPRDTPEISARKREELLGRYGREVVAPSGSTPGGWDFLVGSQEMIDAATDAAGFRYFYDERQQEYAHPAAIMFLTPEGKIARYLYGLSFNPNDVRFALLEASEGRSITTTERVLLYCYAYDADEHSYALVAVNVMKIGGGLTVLLLGGFLFSFWRRERRGDSRELPGDTHNDSGQPADPKNSGGPHSMFRAGSTSEVTS